MKNILRLLEKLSYETIKRIYLGINEEIAESLNFEARYLEKSCLEEGLKKIDDMMVIPRFLSK